MKKENGNNGKRGVLFAVKRAGDLITDLLFPRRCPVCDDVLPADRKYVCRDCAKKLVYIREPFCAKCGRALSKPAEYCRDCANRRHAFQKGEAVFDYGSISESLFRFKNKGRAEYARFYAKAIYETRKDFIRAISPDVLIPVPIHESRLRKRGYNQAEEIAKILGELSGIPVETGLVRRTRKTAPLKSLTLKERQNNLKNAFNIRENDVKLKTVMLIDDIYTTGSTLDEISRILKERFSCEVFFLTVTIGRGV
ncbi:MAG: ComF family protein [Lachnospiraceae bacterium]|nr:ComF family protein [Lachnospiraceae bacterium]